MLTTTPLPQSNPLRDTITKAYRMDETECLNRLLPEAALSKESLDQVAATARQLVIETREYKKKQSKIDTLLHQYDLSTEEGIALMCLAEALLRIPDKATMDKFISDKISTAEWKSHLSTENPLFINAATWSLVFTGKVFAPTLKSQKNLMGSLKRAVSRLGVAVIRPFILQMMKTIGTQFVMGQDIDSALKRAQKIEDMGYRFSYDMLGEAARTAEDASHYYTAYEQAIAAIGKVAHQDSPITNPGISVKLSALSPRFEYTQRERVLKEVPPLLLALAQQAKQYNIGLTIDAEEADRLDLMLDIFEMVYTDASLDGWTGLGIVVQAYQKRASFVIDWLADLAKRHGKRIMLRLVKGAYWDAEIKMSQVQGFNNYPVFTRKNSTDVSYLACAKQLLSQPQCFYPQFGTHNAYSVAAIMEIAQQYNKAEFEFQCLHGMGRPLYDQIVDKTKFNLPCRIYAPVGTHKDLLGYLVRRLLENGANSSFVNRLADESIPMEKIIADPVAYIVGLENKRHPKIPLPQAIYGEWLNSSGIDLSNTLQLAQLKKAMETAAKETWTAGSIVNGKVYIDKNPHPVVSPSHIEQVIGYASKADETLIEEALQTAVNAAWDWATTPVTERAAILERAAEIFQQEMPALMAIVTQEGGRCIQDCLSEVREAIDYCRYYAYRARHDLMPMPLPGPTGESNQLSLHPRGVIACISPWNFPIAIFTGQIVAALAAGNPVIAKPAEQTPLIAFKTIEILHQAGIPKPVLQLLIGPGSVVGAKLVSDPRIAGVIFTGSTETAKRIEQSLANRTGPIALFIAETGGQNAMIVDSSALPEQTVIDIAQSAFNSAGQRCSALRVLFVQEEIAPRLLAMLKGYMEELTIGDPRLLATDIGPVIDNDALQMLKNHFAKMSHEAKLIAQVPMRESPSGHYFAPCVFEIEHLGLLEREVFGPILHVIRYQARDLDKVMDAIIRTGYGLTLGIHSRIEATVQYIQNRMPVGNIYVNRNMIGAVVGVQPFGGERLSGTGPKAGGPHYLPRLCVEHTVSTNTTAVGGNARLISLLEED
ncbi:bifunctional proline dehydrogenase/L-glutamate gamma-semialdehyde dehydrogenase PutA [Aquicella lusitana]|uniref:Bifunctional protein PutA n=1 Tax=Aquicella lusitana TaxID=254246 RepID=A0A370GTR1_9COXI|nr:bifunctional proline dehydrogenase/L-glutamate gamma-semialdehyde dehydrogenase PutA [Aquicella lusitana]RDI46881.1 L-proline dehydrogenase /delta-1-pyrroline-5-carboxylate dehydrogenase [Aquicella lusitana]VVC73772.1 Bifunctional protein PutA [Aquicella lusitana]